MKIGDRVSVIDEDLSGKIISILGDEIQLQDEHGFEYFFHQSRVVVQNEAFYHNISVIQKEETTKNISKKHTKNEMVLDLHFDKLVKNPQVYNPWERLFIQKEKLQETLDFCRANKIKNLEIIHGLGDGTLQNMVYEVLKNSAHIELEENEFFKHSSASVKVIIL